MKDCLQMTNLTLWQTYYCFLFKDLSYILTQLLHYFKRFPHKHIPLPLDTIIVQVQQWGVVGAQRVEDQVLLNGFSFTGKEVSNIIKIISADALLPTIMSMNQTAVLSKKITIYC